MLPTYRTFPTFSEAANTGIVILDGNCPLNYGGFASRSWPWRSINEYKNPILELIWYQITSWLLLLHARNRGKIIGFTFVRWFVLSKQEVINFLSGNAAHITIEFKWHLHSQCSCSGPDVRLNSWLVIDNISSYEERVQLRIQYKYVNSTFKSHRFLACSFIWIAALHSGEAINIMTKLFHRFIIDDVMSEKITIF